MISTSTAIARSSPHHPRLAPKMDNSHSPPALVSSTSNQQQPRNCRRKIAFHPTLGYAIPPPLPAKVARRNERERKRVKQVNCGFDYLRSHIPSAAKQKKMSKVDTLRHAVEYIQSLQRMLSEQSGSETPNRETPSPSLPPPLTIPSSPMPPPVPTPGSASSENTPPAIAPCAFVQQQHQQQFQYPSPLTPRTPSLSDFSQYSESGFDSASSYYTTPPPPPHPSFIPHSSPQSHSPVSSSHYPQVQQQQQGYSDAYFPTDNSEEDDILDVIARWQDQED